jgi:hypothetical protein
VAYRTGLYDQDENVQRVLLAWVPLRETLFIFLLVVRRRLVLLITRSMERVVYGTYPALKTPKEEE